MWNPYVSLCPATVSVPSCNARYCLFLYLGVLEYLFSPQYESISGTISTPMGYLIFIWIVESWFCTFNESHLWVSAMFFLPSSFSFSLHALPLNEVSKHTDPHSMARSTMSSEPIVFGYYVVAMSTSHCTMFSTTMHFYCSINNLHITICVPIQCWLQNCVGIVCTFFWPDQNESHQV